MGMDPLSNPKTTAVQQPQHQLVEKAAILSPAAYGGQRISMASRTAGQQPEPLIQPPKVPLPWTPATDVRGARPWLAIQAHVALSLKLAVGRPVSVLLIHADELSGPLRCRTACTAAAATDSTRAATRGCDAATAAAMLQRRADAADVRIVHDDLDVLVFSATSEVNAAMRADLARRGHRTAVEALRQAATLDEPAGEEMLAWIRRASEFDACPTPSSECFKRGSTVDFGLHDGQQSRGGGPDSQSSVPDSLRGGNAHTQLAARIDGQKDGALIAPSSSAIRTDTYAEHRRHVVPSDRRFANVTNQGRCAGNGKSKVDEGTWARMPSARTGSRTCSGSFPPKHDRGHLSAAYTLRGANTPDSHARAL